MQYTRTNCWKATDATARKRLECILSTAKADGRKKKGTCFFLQKKAPLSSSLPGGEEGAFFVGGAQLDRAHLPHLPRAAQREKIEESITLLSLLFSAAVESPPAAFLANGEGGGRKRGCCFLTKIFLLSDENVFNLTFDKNSLEPCF